MNSFNLKNKVALITGGNGGIGLGIAKGLALSGATVVISGRNNSKTSQALSWKSSTNKSLDSAISMDVTNEKSIVEGIQSIKEKFGKIDILVNNAGINIRKAPEQYNLTEWNSIISTNLTGVFLCCQKVYPLMATAGHGKIINIGSMTSVLGIGVTAAYSSSKGGVVQLTKSLALAWAKDNIQVNTILPGWIETDLTAPLQATDPIRYSSITNRIPAQRWGQPDDLVGAAIFLSSKASDYVTGISLPVDGGYLSS
ncbi:MAG: 2-deoxy-D-gluconate 3-dehydrogenase [Chloroflexota bacterium]|mgnify:FL=1|nr:MAG: 2-deoxy-D-gluconate 3-dehydrogenase [Chloroflexota bacterium]